MSLKKRDNIMKLLKVILSATAMTAFAMSAQAQDDLGIYVNLGVQTLEFDTFSVLGRAGYDFSPNFGVEVEGAIGFSGQEEDGVEFTTPFTIGGYFVTRYPIGSDFELLGRIGYSNINFEAEGLGQTVDTNIDGLATGGGVQYNFDKKSGLRLDFTNLITNGGDANVVDISYVRRF